MITESFLNVCFSLILCKKTNIKKSKNLYRDILNILNFQETKKTIEVPVTIQNKVECLKQMCSMLLTDKSIDNIIDSISFSHKYDELRNFLDSKIDVELKDTQSADIVKQIRLRLKVNNLFNNFDELNNVLNSIKDGSFDSLDDMINDYEITIRKLYANLMESNRNVTIEAAASLDLEKDSYENVIDMIKRKYDRSNKTPTGFQIFDGSILLGGFEPSRLYIFGGGSGSGKSTMLNNLIVNSACNDLSILTSNKEKSSKKKVYIYITLENTIEEALLRTYQPMFNKSTSEVLMEISSGIDIKRLVVDELKRSNSTIIMKYFPAMSISTLDVMGVIDDVIEEYGKESIMGIYLDYLDLLKTDTKYDLYRMELGYITLSLKTMAVQYNIPVITATQLGRSVYTIGSSAELNLSQMGESIKKVEHSDFVCLLAKDGTDDTIVHAKVGKNRSGIGNASLSFKVDFNRFKFLTGSKASNSKKQDNASEGVLSFSGLNNQNSSCTGF